MAVYNFNSVFDDLYCNKEGGGERGGPKKQVVWPK